MPHPDDYMAVEPITKMLTAEEDLDPQRLSDLVNDYIDAKPRKAVTLMVILTMNMGDRIMLDASSPGDGYRMQLMHTAFDSETNKPIKDDERTEPMEFSMHLIEHYVNGEVAELYDHLLELTEDQAIFLDLIAAAVTLYRKIMALGTSDRVRMTTVLMDDNGIEVVDDIGNTSIGESR